jgi:hypothetical protein
VKPIHKHRMTEKEAQTTLELPDDFDIDSVEDAYDQKLWEVRDYVFRNTPVRTLFQARIRRLNRVEEAVAFLAPELISVQESVILAFELESNWPLLQFLRAYEGVGADLRKVVSSGKTADAIAVSMDMLLSLQGQYNEAVHSHFQHLELGAMAETGEFVDPEVKIIKQLDSGVFIKHLEKLEEIGIDPTAPTEIPEEYKSALSDILTEAHRVKKLLLLEQKSK